MEASQSQVQPDPPAQQPDAQPNPPDEAQPQAPSEPDLTDAQKSDLDRLEQLHNDGVLNDDQYQEAQDRVKSGAPAYDPNAPAHAWGPLPNVNTPPGPSQEQIDAATAGSSGEVPETRPQAFQQGAAGAGISDASKRLDQNVPHGPDEIAAANSEENKKAAVEASRTPNLLEGQRVQILGPNPEAGRMAFVSRIVYKDGVQELLARSDTAERRFAEVLGYIVITRDGRSDTLFIEPDQLKPLDTIQGWGRGQI